MKPSTPMIERAVIACIIMLVLLAMLTLLTGCAKDLPQPTPALSVAGEGLARAEAERQVAVKFADMPDVVKQVLGEDGQAKSISESAAAIRVAVAETHALRESRLRAEAEYAAEVERFFSFQQRVLFWWTLSILVGAWLIAGVVAVGLSVATAGSSGVAGWLFSFLPLAGAFKWAARILRGSR